MGGYEDWEHPEIGCSTAYNAFIVCVCHDQPGFELGKMISRISQCFAMHLLLWSSIAEPEKVLLRVPPYKCSNSTGLLLHKTFKKEYSSYLRT